MAGPMGKAVSFQGGGDTYEVREVFEVEEEVEVDEDGNELPPRASSKPAARGGARGEATAASKERTAAAATEAAMAEGRSDAAKRAVSAARHEALKRISSEKAAGVAARFARSVSLSPNELLPFTLVAKLREGHSGPVTRAVWADDARHIASCALDGSVAVWDTRTCMVRRQYTGHHGPVRTVRAGPRLRAYPPPALPPTTGHHRRAPFRLLFPRWETMTASRRRATTTRCACGRSAPASSCLRSASSAAACAPSPFAATARCSPPVRTTEACLFTTWRSWSATRWKRAPRPWRRLKT